MAKLQYTFKNDILFKMLFVKNPDLLKALVAVILDIPAESIAAFEILNPEMTPEHIKSKFCRLDINMRVNDQQVNLEIQVNWEEHYPERTLFYWARDYSSALASGEDYSQLPRTIVASIVDFVLFDDSGEYRSFFQPREITRHTLLSDKLGFYFFELPKLPETVNENDPLLLWMSLFSADTEEKLEKIKKMEVPVMSEAINAYRSITVSPEYRELERIRDRALHDEATALRRAKDEGRNEGINEKASEIASKLIKLGMSSLQIIEITGLPLDEVEKLRSAVFLS